MSDAAPPPWVRHTKSPGLTATLKYLLIVLWGWGDYTRTGPEEFGGERQPAKVEVCWACRDTIARESGQAVGTVKGQLAKLESLGWIRRSKNGTRTELAWREPHRFVYGWPVTEPERPDIKPAQNQATLARNEAGVASDQAAGWPQTGPHNVPVSSNQLPINVGGDGRATLPPSETRASLTSESSPASAAPRTSESQKPQLSRGVGADPQPTRETRPHGPTPKTTAPRPACDHEPTGGLPRSRGQAQVDDSTPARAERGTSTATPGARGRHERLAAQRRPDNGRADPRRLSPELWEVIEACGWEQQARAATWCERANESLERVLEGERPATLRKVLEAWDVSTHQGGVLRPKKLELWDWRGAKWREAVLGTGNAAKPKGKFDGGLGPKRAKARDYDGPGEISPDAARSWV